MDSNVIVRAEGKTGFQFLSAYQIKMIAIIAMLIDHIAGSFLNNYTILGQVMHIIGRLTAPIMCFFIAQGYIHTRSFKRYLTRLGLFALISHIPFVFRRSGGITFEYTGVIYTLALGLITIYVYDKVSNKFLRWLLIILISILSFVGDWPLFGIAFCLIFYVHRDNFKKQCIGIISVGVVMEVLMISSYLAMNFELKDALINSLYQFAIVLSLPILYLYNGQRGGNKYSGWLFYLFYPVHLVLIGIIKYWVF